MNIRLTMILSIFTLATVLSAPAVAGDVSLSAAASLREVINELADGFTRTHPDVRFLKNYGGSGSLAKQVESGAPADIFISANEEWMDYLRQRGLVDTKSIDTFTFNVLVFAGRPELKVAGMQDLVKLERIAIGSPKSVPAGEYAAEAIRKAGIDRQLEKKLVMAKDVRECLMYADRGDVDGAFVYRTDARQVAKQAKILFVVPQQLYPRVTYPMSLTVTGSRKPEAAAFYRFLQSAEARTILVRHGFVLK